MNTVSQERPALQPQQQSQQPTQHRARALGGLLIAEALLSFAPLVVLGQAIGWPASLSKPAAQQLAGIAAAPQAVALGYGLYLLYSVLIAPVMIGLAARIFGSLGHPVAATVAAFAALSALARAIGIARWLTVMPVLAAGHQAADPATRSLIEWVFLATNSYGGGIGELVGVSLMMALALGTLSLGAMRHRQLPRGLAWLGVITAALLLSLWLPTLQVAIRVPIALPVTAVTLWMLAMGGWCLRGHGTGTLVKRGV